MPSLRGNPLCQPACIESGSVACFLPRRARRGKNKPRRALLSFMISHSLVFLKNFRRGTNHLEMTTVLFMPEERNTSKMRTSSPPMKERPMTLDHREDPWVQPCLLVAHSDATYAALVARSFRRRGWDVYPARSGPEARRLALMLNPDLIVMATDLEQETGWLTCEKLTRELPGAKIFLVGDANEKRNREFAVFVGAVALLDHTDSVQALVEEVCGRSLPAAG
jgi:CheY-like chemotaxis protein